MSAEQNSDIQKEDTVLVIKQDMKTDKFVAKRRFPRAFLSSLINCYLLEKCTTIVVSDDVFDSLEVAYLIWSNYNDSSSRH